MIRSLFQLLVLLVFLSACSKKNVDKLQGKKIEFVDLFSMTEEDEFLCYRIPSILKAANGNLIAAIDERNTNCGDLKYNKDINIVIRTSSDNGESWSEIKTVVDYPFGESASDPSMILDQATGEIFMFFNYMNLEVALNDYFLQYVSSKDNGVTWSAPVDITSQISKPEWAHDFKFITSGRGIQTSSGTLLHTLVNLKNGLHVFGSNDHGESWFLIDTPILPGDESKLVELNDHSWMINSRGNKSGLRYVHTSKDDGANWETRADSTLIDPGCNASIIRYTSLVNGDDKNRLLFSNANTKDAREHLTIKVSYDEGQTWKYSKLIYAGKAAYSTMCILENGDVGIFFEKDDYKENVFAKVSLSWLTDGEDAI